MAGFCDAYLQLSETRAVVTIFSVPGISFGTEVDRQSPLDDAYEQDLSRFAGCLCAYWRRVAGALVYG